MIIRTSLLLALTTTALLSGCASNQLPTFGESLKQRSAEQQALAGQWSEGSKLLKRGKDNVEDGQSKIDRGQKLLDEGQKQLKQGQEQLAKGTQLKQEAEAGYLKLRANPIPLPSSVPAPDSPAAAIAPVTSAEPVAAPAP
ncbi:MAG: hypothetical protein AABY68_09085 [Pseudomonadota bacterium]